MGHEVTFADYDRPTRRAPLKPGPVMRAGAGGTRPVINVSRADAKAYVTRLNGQTGKAYRLPSVEDCYAHTYTGAPSDRSVRASACASAPANVVIRGGTWASPVAVAVFTVQDNLSAG